MVHIKIDKQAKKKKKILLQVAAGWGLPRLTLAAHYTDVEAETQR